MKKWLPFIYFIFLTGPTWAQLNGTSFDFFVGDWQLEWKDKDGKWLKGSNLITKILDGKVIQENFEAETGFKGTSISVFNEGRQQWHQAWADNQGGYFNFTGDMVSGNPCMTTIPREKNGKIFISRMLFRDITENSLVWDWESTVDGGQTWKLNWQIMYKRK